MELIKSYKHWASNCKVLRKLALRMGRDDFCPATSIVANPERWSCQVTEDLGGGQVWQDWPENRPGLQPLVNSALGYLIRSVPWAVPQAGIGRAFGALMRRYARDVRERFPWLLTELPRTDCRGCVPYPRNNWPRLRPRAGSESCVNWTRSGDLHGNGNGETYSTHWIL
ncbi:MAG: hypothetical protein JWQ49_5413 [Edaphobacter sp.]|nr:hypothetical protein [Edaphobacter sp.]